MTTNIGRRIGKVEVAIKDFDGDLPEPVVVVRKDGVVYLGGETPIDVVYVTGLPE
jgi:hypothetical protein